MKSVRERLHALGPGVLQGIRRGIEKESLRVRPDGTLAATAHPTGLGSALTHPHITTDFSEAQLELITGVHAGVESCLEELTAIHQEVYRQIGDELLWCASMPCGLPAEDAIPIGRYGRSNVGQAKTVYRIGLAHRYGRRMQTISGIHYNFSLPGVSNEAYFALIRNFRRQSWLLLYLFGASPAVCASFVEGREHDLETLAPGTLYRPWATSLRMGPLGYQSDAQASLAASRATPPRCRTRLPSPGRPTRRSGCARAASTASSARASSRSRTSSTARFGRSASSAPASARCMPCASGAWSTSRCA